METWLKAKADEEKANGGTHWFQSGWESLVSRGAMNRKQKACLLAGFFLLVLSLLFPPMKIHLPAWPGVRGASYRVSYGFLFTMRGTVEFSRLIAEWLLIGLVVGGLLFWFRNSNDCIAISSKSESLSARTIGWRISLFKLKQQRSRLLYGFLMLALLAFISLGLYNSYEMSRAKTSQAQTLTVTPTVSKIKPPEQITRSTWLDEPLKDWNGAVSGLPDNTWSFRDLPAECEPETRKPYNEVEKTLRDRGWFFVDDSNLTPIVSDPRYSDTSVVEAVAGFGGMCRAEPVQAFIFYRGMYVGTLVPVLSYEDVALSTIRISGPLTLQAEFLSYLPTDGRCCPSIKRSVSYEIQGSGEHFVLRAIAVAQLSS